jgi:hypothetical protein
VDIWVKYDARALPSLSVVGHTWLGVSSSFEFLVEMFVRDHDRNGVLLRLQFPNHMRTHVVDMELQPGGPTPNPLR